MTREEILKMEAGRELDALIYAKVFNGMPFRSDGNWVYSTDREYLEEGDAYYLDENQRIVRMPEYSSDVRAAWGIVEMYTDAVIEKVGDHYCVNLFVENNCAETAPLAICRAALLAVMAEV